MRTLVLFLLCIVLVLQARSATYYFSATGDDSRSAAEAQRSSTPWRSVSKLNSIASLLQPGDSVLFKRGETFYGSFQLTRSGTAGNPIVIGAYGTGENPVITGLTTLSSWVSLGGGIYESSQALSVSMLNMVLFNNRVQEMGRYPNADAPNKGFLYYESHNGIKSITDNELTASPNWTGAEVVVRAWKSAIDRATVTSHVGGTLYADFTYDGDDGFGYFLQNDLRTLDQPGEWFFNQKTGKLAVFFGSRGPSAYTVQASTKDTLVYATDRSYLTFFDLSFRGANQTAMFLRYCNNIQLKGCEFLYSGNDALFANGTSYLTVTDCSFNYTHSNAIETGIAGEHWTLRGNTIKNTAIFEGMCQKGNLTGYAIYSRGANQIIENNEIDSVGYCAIRFTGDDNILVKNNVINYFNLIKDDGGAIYTYKGSGATNRRVIGNVILNGVGAAEGLGKTQNYSTTGVYLDIEVTGVEIADNTIANCSKTGIYIHNSFGVTIRNNILFNNTRQLVLRYDNLNSTPIRKMVIKNNLFFSKRGTQYLTDIYSVADDLNQIGVVDSNYYCRPTNEDMAIWTSAIAGDGKKLLGVYDLSGWQRSFVHDARSQKTARQLLPYRIDALVGENKMPNETFSTTASGITTNPAATTSWVSNKLDGGTFQATVAPEVTYYQMVVPVGGVQAGKTYLVRFSAQCSKDTVFSLFVRQRKGDFLKLSETPSFKLNTVRGEYEFLLKVSASEPDAALLFTTKGRDMKFWLDNFKVHEATITEQDPESRIRFEYNATAVPKTIQLDGLYVDVKDNTYSNQLTLKPYSSIVLLMDDEQALDSKPAPNQAPTVALTAPTSNASFSAPAAVSLTATAQDSDGSIAKVEFFSGTTLIGTATTAPYTINWNNVAAGSYSLTAKATDNQGLTATSTVVTITVKAPVYTFYRDADGDGYGTENDKVTATTAPAGYVLKSGDCNDNNKNVNPGAVEICGNGIDDNCNGKIDEDCPAPEPEVVLASVSVNDTTVSQSAGVAYFTVRLTKAHNLPVSVRYKTTDGTARANVHYTATEGVLTIPAGSLSGMVKVNLAQKSTQKPVSSNYLYLLLSNPVNGTLAKGTGKLTITYKKQTGVGSARNSSTESKEELLSEQVLQDQLSLAAYPNPSSNYFTISMKGMAGRPINLTIVDLNGRVVERRNNISVNGTLQIGQDLPKGFYMVQISQGPQMATLKINKQ